MSQREGGLYRLLSHPWVYRAVQTVAGSDRGRELFVSRYVRPKPGQRILDIGCGTADVLELFPESVDYVGFDMNPAYIEQAKKRFAHRKARFFCALYSAEHEQKEGGYDIVLAQLLIHHLADADVRALYATAKGALAPGGRFITIDPCFAPGQSLIMHWITSLDRGGHVRTPQQHDQLCEGIFPERKSEICMSPGWIPYAAYVQECSSAAG